jgi:hypothetical protein
VDEEPEVNATACEPSECDEDDEDLLTYSGEPGEQLSWAQFYEWYMQYMMNRGYSLQKHDMHYCFGLELFLTGEARRRLDQLVAKPILFHEIRLEMEKLWDQNRGAAPEDGLTGGVEHTEQRAQMDELQRNAENVRQSAENVRRNAENVQRNAEVVGTTDVENVQRNADVAEATVEVRPDSVDVEDKPAEPECPRCGKQGHTAEFCREAHGPLDRWATRMNEDHQRFLDSLRGRQVNVDMIRSGPRMTPREQRAMNLREEVTQAKKQEVIFPEGALEERICGPECVVELEVEGIPVKEAVLDTGSVVNIVVW